MSIKKHYLIFVLAIVAMVVFSSNFYGKLSHDYSEQNRILSEIADARAKKISEALSKEKRLREDILVKMQDQLDNSKAEYEKKIKDLEEKKRKEIKSFVDKQGEDPKRMAESLSESTGFKVYNER
jgi:Skp family chaperone for outer membrane proteins